MENVKVPIVVKGKVHIDDRGEISFVNDFKFDSINRFYIICNSDTQPFRGWQGHKIDNKFFYCVQGKVKVHFVKIDNWIAPSKDLRVECVVLNSVESNVLHIPEGYANAIESLEINSKLISFSTLPLTSVREDEVRYPPDYWPINEL
jgi:dTDP-4-dehydrorhamnose 3,5-epimerase-like enzyme